MAAAYAARVFSASTFNGAAAASAALAACSSARCVCLAAAIRCFEVRQALFGRLLPRLGLGQLLRGGVGLNRRLLQLLLRWGQNCLGRVGRFALGGGIGGGLLACRIELDDFLGRFLGRLVRGRGGGHLVLGVRQGRVGGLLLRLRFRQLLRGGRQPEPALLARSAAPEQGRPWPRRPLCAWRRHRRWPVLLCVRLGGIRGNLFGLGCSLLGRLLGCRRSRGGGGYLVLDVRQGRVGRFFCAVASVSALAAALAWACSLLLALPCLGQRGRGISSRFAFGGRLGCRQLLSLRGLREILSRLLGCRRSRGGGGYLVLDVRQASVGQLLLRRRPGQLLRRGVGQLLRILLGCLCLGQGRLGRVGRLALGGGVVRPSASSPCPACGHPRQLAWPWPRRPEPPSRLPPKPWWRRPLGSWRWPRPRRPLSSAPPLRPASARRCWPEPSLAARFAVPGPGRPWQRQPLCAWRPLRPWPSWLRRRACWPRRRRPSPRPQPP